MIPLEDIEIRTGRAVGGDFMEVIHRPTGISRRRGPPLSNPGHAREEMLREIEAELTLQQRLPVVQVTSQGHA